MVVLGWAPEATIGARISSPSARVTPTTRPSRTSIEATGAPVRISAPAASAERAIAWLIAPMPPDHLAPAARDPVDLAERVVEQVVGGARRARAGPDADHAGRGDRALEPLVLEPVVEQVGDRHREDADQVVDVATAEPGRARTLAQQGDQIARVMRAEGRRLAQHHRPQERRGAVEQVLEALVHLAVALREGSDRGRRAGRLVEEEDRPFGAERRIGRVERDRPIAVVAQAQVRDDLRLEHRDHVARPRDACAGPDLLGHAGPAQDRPPLEHHDAQPGVSQVGRGGQPVVAAADDDRVIGAGRAGRGGGAGVGVRVAASMAASLSYD